MTLSQSLVIEYASKMSDTDAAAELGISMVAFYNARKRFQIPSFFESTGKRKSRSGEIFSFMQYNDRYFQTIDSPDKAYFLGLLAADGNVNSRLTAVRIALKESDCTVLERFRNYLGEDSPTLKTKQSKIGNKLCCPQKILVLSRKSMVNDLLNLGITPNKSLTLKVSCNLGGFTKDFLRGVWDGDGSITERRFKVATASICFAHQLQSWIFDVSDVKLPIKKEISKSGNPLYSISGYMKDSRVIQAIYGESELGIERKIFAYKQYWEARS